MLDFRRVNALTLRTDDGTAALDLAAGAHGIGRDQAARIAIVDDARALAHLRVDACGVWLSIPQGTRGVHVNGRPVQHLAMLRAGDSLHLDGTELTLLGRQPDGDVERALRQKTDSLDDDPRVVLRGVGGRYHGRCFRLQRPCLIGSHAQADIAIDSPGFAARHARLEACDEGVLLRDLGSADGTCVNGHRVRDALLRGGDQVMFDAGHRFVVEAPSSKSGTINPIIAPPSTTPLAPRKPEGAGKRIGRWPLLLIAAAVIAAGLSALLLWGVPS